MIIEVAWEKGLTGHVFLVKQKSHGGSPKKDELVRDWTDADELLNRLMSGNHQAEDVVHVLSSKYEFCSAPKSERVRVTLS